MGRGRRFEVGLSFEAKEQIALIVVRDALKRFVRPAVVWSAGKDSTTVLHLVRRVCGELGLQMPPALFIDHGQHFDETLEMVDRVSGEWGFRVVVARNDDVLKNVGGDNMIRVGDLSRENQEEARRIGFKGEEFEYSLDNVVANHLLKTVPMKVAIERYRFDALFTGIRWDENEARSTEVFISPRTNPDHVRVQPILPFTERNVWEYVFKYNLPIHPLYRQGYRSIDGKFDSKKVGDLPAWEQDLEHTDERGGRSQDKEALMWELRRLGYM